METNELETVYVAIGVSEDPDAERIPVTIHDLRSRRVRYTYLPRSQLAVLGLGIPRTFISAFMGGRGVAKWQAYWIQPQPMDRGEWRLADIVSELGTEAA